jgi:hypothetical protein
VNLLSNNASGPSSSPSRLEPDDPTLRYGGAGRSEDKLRHFTGTPFYQALLPETQNILRHIQHVEWLRPPRKGIGYD